jgi:hypothetical protein
LANYYLKLRGPKYVDKFIAKYGELGNNAGFGMQLNLLGYSKIQNAEIQGALGGFAEHKATLAGLLKQVGAADKKQLQNDIRKMIQKVQNQLMSNDDPRRLKILQVIKDILKDESCAYKAGGHAESLYAGTPGQTTNSEMFAKLYDEAVKVTKQEIKQQRISNIKKFFGIKPKNISPEENNFVKAVNKIFTHNPSSRSSGR